MHKLLSKLHCESKQSHDLLLELAKLPIHSLWLTMATSYLVMQACSSCSFERDVEKSYKLHGIYL